MTFMAGYRGWGALGKGWETSLQGHLWRKRGVCTSIGCSDVTSPRYGICLTPETGHPGELGSHSLWRRPPLRKGPGRGQLRLPS